jgi:hypothetical protein
MAGGNRAVVDCRIAAFGRDEGPLSQLRHAHSQTIIIFRFALDLSLVRLVSASLTSAVRLRRHFRAAAAKLSDVADFNLQWL